MGRKQNPRTNQNPVVQISDPEEKEIGAPTTERNEKKTAVGPRWGRGASISAIGKIIKRKRKSPNNAEWCKRSMGRIKNRGRQPKHIIIRHNGIGKNRTDRCPVALSKWADWCGGNATEMKDRTTERLTGRMVSYTSRNVCQGLFNKWRIRRGRLENPNTSPHACREKRSTRRP